MGLELSLIIPDTHIPYEDLRAYDLMLEVASFYKTSLKEICILGDYLDFYAVSSHDKDPRINSFLLDEIEKGNKRLDELDKLFPEAKKVYIEGNHENRLERYLFNKAPELFGITDLTFLLKLNERENWKVIPYEPGQYYKVLNSKLRARHEPLSSSAKATAAKAICSIVHGHDHRMEESHIVGLDNINHVCFSVGWLGDKRKSVFKYVKSHHQWQLGFGLVWVDKKTRYFYHQKVQILDNYTLVINGKKFKS